MPHEGHYNISTFSLYSCPKLSVGFTNVCANSNLLVMLVHPHPNNTVLPKNTTQGVHLESRRPLNYRRGQSHGYTPCLWSVIHVCQGGSLANKKWL